VNTGDERTGARHLRREQGLHGRRDSNGYPPGKRDAGEYAEGLFKTEGPLCGACPFREPCGAMTSAYACLPWYGRDAPGGLEALHPHNLDFTESISRLGGTGLDIDARRGIAIPRLPSFLAGINVRTALKEQLREPAAFTVRARDVILKNQVRPASEFRSRLGLADKQLIVLLLFGKDRLLEALWEHRETLLPQIAAGGFDAVTAPSYSLWIPWPRPNHLLSLKKSLLIFRSLQELGVAAIPRLAWAVTRDVKRHAEWCGRNDHIDTVALDLTTYRSPADWLEQNQLLAEFDRLTNERLHYLVNGPTVRGRYRDIQNSTAPERIAFTNATFVGPPSRITKTDSPSDSFAMARIRIHEEAIAA
jgi:Domain of unknown function (DUF4417)